MPNLSKLLCCCLSLWLIALSIEASENQEPIMRPDNSQAYPSKEDFAATAKFLDSKEFTSGPGFSLPGYPLTLQAVRDAAEQGIAEFQAQLGDRYLLGKGVEKDCLQAHAWYWKASRQGHFRAALFLAFLEQRLTDCTLAQTGDMP